MASTVFIVSVLTFVTPMASVKANAHKSRSSLYDFHFRDLFLNDPSMFELPVRSKGECASLCTPSPCCSGVTFQKQSSPADSTCRGHFRLGSVGSNSTSALGSETYRKRQDPSRNVALNKPAQQSSLHGIYHAGLAVDGDSRTEHMVYVTCAHTERTAGQSSWWQVDLEALYQVCYVIITNRGDNTCGSDPSCANRLRDFDLHVYDEDPVTNPGAKATLCYHYNRAMPMFASEQLPCINAPVTGRYVRLTNTPFEYISICEVEVWAFPAA